MFAVAYVVLLSLWFVGSTVGIGWSGAFVGMAMVLVPAHVAVRFIEGRTSKPFVQRRCFAIAWGFVLTVVMISPVLTAATKSTGSDGEAVALIVGLVSIVVAPVIAALHLRAIWIDRELPADGPAA